MVSGTHHEYFSQVISMNQKKVKKVIVESVHFILLLHLKGQHTCVFLMLHLRAHAGRQHNYHVYIGAVFQLMRGVSHSSVPLCVTAVQPANVQVLELRMMDQRTANMSTTCYLKNE